MGRVFNFRYGCVCESRTSYITTKLSNLKWQTRPKQYLGYLPLPFPLPSSTVWIDEAGNTIGVSITVPLTSCLTGLESAVWQLTMFVFICKTDQSKLVKQEVNDAAIPPSLVLPGHPLSMYSKTA
jgi:hypothetical protein